MNLLDLTPPPRRAFCAEASPAFPRRRRHCPQSTSTTSAAPTLFRQICELPEYYITRAETEILATHGDDIAALLRPRAQVVGLGTGGGRKARTLLTLLADPVAYMPVDVDNESLAASAVQISRALPALEVLPVAADFLQRFCLASAAPESPSTSSSIFPVRRSAISSLSLRGRFLERLAKICRPGGALIIGVDLQKTPEIIERAYNDAAGVTAQFNLNLLVRANRELGADFDIASWQHRAIYNPTDGRIEMHLVSRERQTVHIGGQAFVFEAGEWIVTEYSYKHSRDGFTGLARRAGFEFQRLWTDRQELFGVFLFVVPD